jgi:hypothetical protein
MKLWGIHGLRVPLCASVSVLNFGLTLTTDRDKKTTHSAPLFLLQAAPSAPSLVAIETKCDKMQQHATKHDRK